ncbi:MAG: hypothetical protein ACK6BM_00145 [Cyanobacteriota bacterium]|jgi:hypothetical protein
MIDFATALAIAQVVRVPVEQAFLQQIGKQAAAGLVDQLASLRAKVTAFITGTHPGLTPSIAPTATENQDVEELAAEILLAAKRDPDNFSEILEQYHLVKSGLDASRSTGAISASASGGSAITQNVILGGHVHIDTRQLRSPPSSQLDTECSAPARELLSAAATGNGEVLRVLLQDGLVIQAGGRNFVDSSDPRVRARWEEAICELQDLGFLTRPPNPKAEILHVTHKGFEYIDNSRPRYQSEG